MVFGLPAIGETSWGQKVLDSINAVKATADAKLPVFDVVAYGALIDGITDDTAAWQAVINAAAAAGGGKIISSRVGASIIGGALQDTTGANAQLLLPAIDAVDSEQISITIEGATPPPTTFSVIGTTPIPDNHLILKSTLNVGAGGAVIGAQGPVGTFEGFTNLSLQLRNLAVRLPSNPVLTGLNLSKVACVDLDNVVVDCGSYFVQGFTEPTTATSYGIRLPATNNSAYTRLGAVNVAGFYTGYEFAEHAVGQQVAAWGCKRAFEFDTANHASHFQRLMSVHCQRGIVFTGTHYVDVEQFNIEHADAGWWMPVWDVDDASNYGHGTIRWHVVLANSGIHNGFLRNGGTGCEITKMGFSMTRVTNGPTGLQAIPAGTHTAITFTTETLDTLDAHSNTANTSRVTAPVAGWYEAHAQASFSPDPNGYRFVAIWKNGVGTGTRLSIGEAPAVNGDGTVVQVNTGSVWLAAGDYLELGVYSPVAVSANDNGNCWLQVKQIG